MKFLVYMHFILLLSIVALLGLVYFEWARKPGITDGRMEELIQRYCSFKDADAQELIKQVCTL